MSDETTNNDMPGVAVTDEPTSIAQQMPSMSEMKGLAQKTLDDLDHQIKATKDRQAALAAQLRDLNERRVEAARILGALTPRTRKPRETTAATGEDKKPAAPKKPAGSAKKAASA